MKTVAKNPLTNLTVCLLIAAVMSVACMGIKKPWRTYTPKPFDSAEWLAGDKIDRGRMFNDMFRNPKLDIGNRDMTLKSLGEPDLKKTIENKEVWFYRIDLGFGPEGMDLLPVSFDARGVGSVGYAKDGNMSIAGKESEL